MKDVERFSRVSYKDSRHIQKKVFKNYETIASKIDLLLKEDSLVEEQRSPAFPQEMVRRFHCPVEMEERGKAVGLDLERVVYFHFHPLPPIFQFTFPDLYNAYASAMQPFGETPLGAYMGSGFVAMYTKRL